MGQQTSISWAHSTFNPWIGCTKIAPECAHCYAAALDEKRFSKTLEGTKAEPVSHWGKGAPRHMTKAATDGTLFRWNKQPWACAKCGETSFSPDRGNHPVQGNKACWCDGKFERRRVFIGSLMDWADEEVADEWRDRLFDEADKATNLTLMFLTKRGDNALRYLTARYGARVQGPLILPPNGELHGAPIELPAKGGIPPHFWIGYSYMHRNPRAEWLREVKQNLGARITFLSVEPLLAQPNLYPFFAHSIRCRNLPGPGMNGGEECKCVHPDWVIFGGESGPKARPCNVDWIRDGVRQCRSWGALPFVKQMGSNSVQVNGCFTCDSGPEHEAAVQKATPERIEFKHRSGADPAEWAEDLRVQELPV